MSTTTVTVVSFETDEIVHTIETEYIGSQLDKMIDGLMRNMDLGRFYVKTSTPGDNGEDR